MVSKQHILNEIVRLAEQNGGKALGRQAFERASGIREHDWLGRYWVRWSDAITEAGLTPNSMIRRRDDADIFRPLIG